MNPTQFNVSPADALHRLVQAMDRSADQVLQERFGLTYKRAYFLFTLQRLGTVSQHQLATALGYSDASVSTMLAELTHAQYLSVEPSPSHGRKKLVSLTQHGDKLVTEGRNLLDARFKDALNDEHISIREYHEQTERLYSAIVAQIDKESL